MESPGTWNLLIASINVAETDSIHELWAFLVLQRLVRDDDGDRERFDALYRESTAPSEAYMPGPSFGLRLAGQLQAGGLTLAAAMQADPNGEQVRARWNTVSAWLLEQSEADNADQEAGFYQPEAAGYEQRVGNLWHQQEAVVPAEPDAAPQPRVSFAWGASHLTSEDLLGASEPELTAGPEPYAEPERMREDFLQAHLDPSLLIPEMWKVGGSVDSSLYMPANANSGFSDAVDRNSLNHAAEPALGTQEEDRAAAAAAVTPAGAEGDGAGHSNKGETPPQQQGSSSGQEQRADGGRSGAKTPGVRTDGSGRKWVLPKWK